MSRNAISRETTVACVAACPRDGAPAGIKVATRITSGAAGWRLQRQRPAARRSERSRRSLSAPEKLLADRDFPVLAVEAHRFESRGVNAFQAAGVDVDFVGVRTRRVKGWKPQCRQKWCRATRVLNS